MSNDDIYTKSMSLLESGSATKSEAKIAFEDLKTLASEGHIGAVLFFGHFTKDNGDYVNAFNYFKYAYENNSAEGAYWVASCLCKGLGVKENKEMAYNILSDVVDFNIKNGINNPRIIFELGLYYINGVGCAKNDSEAFNCFEHAAKNNVAAAKNSLALCYIQGTGTKVSEIDALYWFQEAAISGYVESYFSLAYILNNPTTFSRRKEMAEAFMVLGARAGVKNCIAFLETHKIDPNMYPKVLEVKLDVQIAD